MTKSQKISRTCQHLGTFLELPNQVVHWQSLCVRVNFDRNHKSLEQKLKILRIQRAKISVLTKTSWDFWPHPLFFWFWKDCFVFDFCPSRVPKNFVGTGPTRGPATLIAHVEHDTSLIGLGFWNFDTSWVAIDKFYKEKIKNNFYCSEICETMQLLAFTMTIWPILWC